jgi:hypothetical protein
MKRRTYVVECESQQLDSKSLQLLQLINGMGMNYGHILTLQYCLKIVCLKFFSFLGGGGGGGGGGPNGISGFGGLNLFS